MADYSIQLGVTVDTSGVQTQINNIKPDPIKIKLEIDKSQINELKSQIQSLNNIKINLGGNASIGSSGGVKNAVNDMNWAYKQMLDVQKKVNSLSLKIGGLDASKNVNELKELSSQLTKLKGDYQTLKNTFGEQLTPIQTGNLQAELDDTTDKLAALEAKIADTKSNLAKGITDKLNVGDFDRQINSITTSASKLSMTYQDVETGINDVKTALSNLNTASASGNIDDIISAYDRLETALKSVKNQIDINAQAERQDNNSEALTLKRANALERLNSLFSENSQAAKMFGAELQQLQNKIEACGNLSSFGNIDKEITNLSLRVKNAGVQTKTFGETLNEQWEHYKSYLSVASVFMYATQAMKSMFEQVKSIDTAMTELKKVTDETDASYDQFLTNAASRAKEIGTTIDGLVTSTADFARLGYDFEDAQGLAEVANIYTVVGDEIDSVDTATQSLVSTMAAFKDEMGSLSDADFALSIVDKFNEVDILAS